MKTTDMGAISEATQKRSVFSDDLAARYCAATHWAFMRLLEGLPVYDIWEKTHEKFRLDARQTNDAVHDAQAVITDLL